MIDYLLNAEEARPEHLPMREKMKSFVARLREPMISEYSPAAINVLMASQGFETVENFPLPELEPRYREDLGDLPLEIPSIFALAVFKVAVRDSEAVAGAPQYLSREELA